MHQITVSDQFSFNVNREKGQLLVNDQPMAIDPAPDGGQRLHVLYKGQGHRVELVGYDKATKTATYKINGKLAEVRLRSQTDLLLDKLGMNKGAKGGANNLKAPMPGLVISVNVTEGQEVKKGDALLVLEAMKMENQLKATGDGVVKRIAVTPGQKVEKNVVLIEF